VALYLDSLFSTSEVRRIAPIEVVMLHEALIMKRLEMLATFERKAGSPFINCFIVSLLKKINYLTARLVTPIFLRHTY